MPRPGAAPRPGPVLVPGAAMPTRPRRTPGPRRTTRQAARQAGLVGAAPAGVVALALTLAGCATPVVVPAAPYASDPTCGVVLQLAPFELVGLERRSTTSQSSRAWGAPEPIVLRCGVEPPGPSTEQCVRVTDDVGTDVDWIALEGETAWTFVTYGRVPAIEIVVPLSVQPLGTQPTTPLVDLSGAVSTTAAERTCL